MRFMSLLLLATVSLSACGDGAADAVPADTGAGRGEDTAVGAPADGGLSVSEALQTEATGPIAVEGFLIDDSGSVRLCGTVMESYPPQCGGASLEVKGRDVATFEGATTAGDVTWVDRATLTGELVEGTLTVSETSP